MGDNAGIEPHSLFRCGGTCDVHEPLMREAREREERLVERMCREGNCVELIDPETGENTGGFGPVGCACQKETIREWLHARWTTLRYGSRFTKAGRRLRRAMRDDNDGFVEVGPPTPSAD